MRHPVDAFPLQGLQLQVARVRHDELQRQDFQHGDLRADKVGNVQVGGVPGERLGAGHVPGLRDRGGGEPPDQLAGQPLQRGRGRESCVVLADRGDYWQLRQPTGGGHQVIGGQSTFLLAEPTKRGGGIVVGKHAQVDPPRNHPVLDVVNGVRDVVGPIHYLSLQARPTGWRAIAHPGEHFGVLRVSTELAVVGTAQPRILGHRVERGAGQVEARADALSIKGFGFQTGEDAQVLGIALEPAVVGGEVVERLLAVVPVRRMADVVSQACHVDQIRVATQPDGHAAADLRNLERMSQPGPRSVAFPRPDHLRLVSEPPQRGAVQNACPIAGEISAMFGRPAGQCGGLRRLDHNPFAVVRVVPVVLMSGHRGTVCQRPLTATVHAARLAIMRSAFCSSRKRFILARLLGPIFAVLAAALLVAPQAAADRPFHLPEYITDKAGVLTDAGRTQVETAINNLYNSRRIRLWVVYVDDFSGQDPASWAETTYRTSNLGAYDAVLAVATVDRAYAFKVPTTVKNVSASQVANLQRNDIEPALHQDDWSGAAVAAANGLNTSGSPGMKVPWGTVLVLLGGIVLVIAGLLLLMRRRRRLRRAAELAAAQRVDATDPEALASLSVDTLDDLSKTKVVEVDNAVRTSTNELALAVEEFGTDRTEPFTRAVNNAKIALAQAFRVRQQLDDTVPETTAQRRDLLTRVIVSAAQADRELDAQTEAFHELRDLVLNAPAKLDTLTQQLVDLTARIAPSQQKLADLHNEFDSNALGSVNGNVTTAQERLKFADQSITRARELAGHPVAGEQAELVDTVRSTESALGQARSMLDAVDSAESDIKRAVGMLPSAIADIQNGIAQADAQLRQGKINKADELTAARTTAAKAVDTAQASGSSDPLGAFTQLTKADAELDRLLADVAEEREAAARLSRTFDQALFTAQSRVRAVSDYIDTRRGSIGPEARTRLAEAVRQLQGAEASRSTDLNEAIAYANGASMLAAQAQSLANADVQAAQRAYTGRYGGGNSNMGAVLGGIIIGNILSGSMRGGFGGGWSSTTYGGSPSSGGGFFGGGGRF